MMVCGRVVQSRVVSYHVGAALNLYKEAKPAYFSISGSRPWLAGRLVCQRVMCESEAENPCYGEKKVEPWNVEPKTLWQHAPHVKYRTRLESKLRSSQCKEEGEGSWSTSQPWPGRVSVAATGKRQGPRETQLLLTRFVPCLPSRGSGRPAQ